MEKSILLNLKMADALKLHLKEIGKSKDILEHK